MGMREDVKHEGVRESKVRVVMKSRLVHLCLVSSRCIASKRVSIEFEAVAAIVLLNQNKRKPSADEQREHLHAGAAGMNGPCGAGRGRGRRCSTSGGVSARSSRTRGSWCQRCGC